MKQASPAQASSFIDSVISLNPRLAVFDCDGTLWSGDAGERFFDWELKRGVVSDEIVRWAREEKLDQLVLHASEQARSLYERMGFTVTNEMRFDGEL